MSAPPATPAPRRATPRDRESVVHAGRLVMNVRDDVRLEVPADHAYTAGMQYTLRNVPGAVDEALRRRAREQHKSLNEVAVEALAEGLGLGRQSPRRRDLSDL